MTRTQAKRTKDECLRVASFQNAKLCRSDVLAGCCVMSLRHKFPTQSSLGLALKAAPLSLSRPATLKFVLSL